MSAGTADANPALARMTARHEALGRQLEQAELAVSADNHWTDQAAVVDQAIAVIDQELQQPAPRIEREELDLPPLPIDVKSLRTRAPSQVHIQIGDHQLEFKEEIDWAERGTNVVRGELQVDGGEFYNLMAELDLGKTETTMLGLSLFGLVTDIRNRALEGKPAAEPVVLSDLLTPCPVCGDVRLWNGVCLNCEARTARLSRLEIERQRLFEERDGILKDRNSAIERLPPLRYRFAESAAALEKAKTVAGDP